MGAFQPWHWVLVVVIALIVFGPSKLPELGASIGKSIREFKKSTREFTEIKDSVKGSVDTVKSSVDSVKGSVSSAVTLDPARPVAPAAPTTPGAAAAAPLPTRPEPRHEGPVSLRREVID